MNGLNKVFLMGRIGSDPEVYKSQKGKPFSRINLATHKWRAGGEGEEGKDMTTWHTVFVWGKQGELCAQYLKKGAPVLIEGYLSSYMTPNDKGEVQWKSSVTAERVDFLSRSSAKVTEEKFES